MRLKQFICLRYEIFQMNSDSINHLYFRWLLKKCRWKTLNRIRTNDQTQAEIHEPERRLTRTSQSAERKIGNFGLSGPWIPGLKLNLNSK